MPTRTEEDPITVAKVAASRAEALRAQAAAVTSEAMEPLRKALLIRAGELDLTAAVLFEDEPSPAPLRAIA